MAYSPILNPHPVSQSGAWSVTVGAALPAGANAIGSVSVTGSVAVTGTFWQATQPVSGTFWQATQPVSGTVAATQSGTWNVGSITTLPALVAGSAIVGKVGIDQTTPGTTNLVANSGIFNTTLPTIVSGNRGELQTNNRGMLIVQAMGGAAGGLADGIGNASAVNITDKANSVDGILTTAGYLYDPTGTWHRARGDTTSGAWVQVKAALPTGANVIGAVTQSGTWNVYSPDVQATGTISVTDAVVAAPAGDGAFRTGVSTANSYVSLALSTGGDSEWTVQITALTSGFLYFEASVDSTTGLDGQWINVNGRRTGIVNTQLGGNATANGLYRGNLAGFKYFRVRSVGALVGSPAIIIRSSVGTGAVFQNASTPAGTNLIGAVSASKGAGHVTFACSTVIAGVTAVTAEALVTMVPVRAGVASATVTTQSVTAAKRQRIQSITVGFISTAAAVLSMRFALRTNPAGAVTATSPILRIIPLSQQAAALAQAGNEMTIDFADGLEFSGTEQWGITQIGSVATGTCWVSAIGYEYTP